jgi:hypothetical protein
VGYPTARMRHIRFLVIIAGGSELGFTFVNLFTTIKRRFATNSPL